MIIQVRKLVKNKVPTLLILSVNLINYCGTSLNILVIAKTIPAFSASFKHNTQLGSSYIIHLNDYLLTNAPNLNQQLYTFGLL